MQITAKKKVHIKLNFILKKMPVTLSPASFQSNDSSNVINKKVKTTTKSMVEKALMEMHNKKGMRE